MTNLPFKSLEKTENRIKIKEKVANTLFQYELIKEGDKVFIDRCYRLEEEKHSLDGYRKVPVSQSLPTPIIQYLHDRGLEVIK